MRFLTAFLLTMGSVFSATAGTAVSDGATPTKIRTFDAANAHAVRFGGKDYYLTTSETDGLALWSQNTSQTTEPVQTYAGRYSLSDAVTLDNTLLVSTINTNTSDVHIVLFSESQAPQTLNIIPPGNADTEAVCLSSGHDYPEVFVVNARGNIHHYALPPVASSKTQPVLLRTISSAPGIKSCSVAAHTQTLYLADEYAGIWAYPTDIESDERRKLLYHHAEHAIEGVSALPDGTVCWVSADDAAVYSHFEGSLTRYALPPDTQPEMVHANAGPSSVTLGVYDDGAERVSVFTIPRTAQPKDPQSSTDVDVVVKAMVETTPVARFGDAADDPAIWYNAKAPAKSLILGTDKKAGLNVYALDGSLQQSLAVGRVNNVDVRYDKGHYFRDADIAVASNRSDNSISVFSIQHQDGTVQEVSRFPTTLNDVYGLCLYQADEEVEVFINSTDGRYQRHRLIAGENGISSSLIEEFTLPTQPEGCVADDARQLLYMGEESAGIWLKNLSGDTDAKRIIDIAGPVKADIEGLALFDIDDTRYLLVSSQGNHSYALFKTDNSHALVGTFSIGINWDREIDGVSETDGLDASNLNFGENFPDGLIVVQDGHNVMPTGNQNFKIVDAGILADAIRSLAN